MCRLLGFAGGNEEEFRKLFSCLRGVAENGREEDKGSHV
jgi:hypothetical protein